MKLAPLLLLAAPAMAGEQAIPLTEWRAMTDGKVVTYYLDGALWGREFFHPGKMRATFVSADGRCMTGPWSFAEGVYCFRYGNVSCFRHIRRDGQLFAEPASGGPIQRIGEITPGALSCEEPVIG